VPVKLSNIDIVNQRQFLNDTNKVDLIPKTIFTPMKTCAAHYLENSTRQNIYQTCLPAHELAKKAELAYRFERKATGQPDLISFGYFDPGRDSPQSG
jgi:hypothetical protein